MNPTSGSAASAAPDPAPAGTPTADPGASVRKENAKIAHDLSNTVSRALEGFFADKVILSADKAEPILLMRETVTEIKEIVSSIPEQIKSGLRPAVVDTSASKPVAPVTPEPAWVEELRSTGKKVSATLEAIPAQIREQAREAVVDYHHDHPYPQPKPAPSIIGWIIAIFALLFLGLCACGYIWYRSPSIKEHGDNVERMLSKHVQDSKEFLKIQKATSDANAVVLAEKSDKAIADLKTDLKKMIENSNGKRNELLEAQATATKTMSDNVLTIQRQAEKLTSIESGAQELKKQADARTAKEAEIIAMLGDIKTKLDAAAKPPPPLPTNPPQPVAEPPPPPPPSGSTQVVPGGPHGAQGGVSNGRFKIVGKWKVYEYAAGESDAFCAKKFLAGDVRVDQTPGAKTIVKNLLPTGFFSPSRRPEELPFPNAYTDAEKVVFRSDKPFYVWER